MTLSFNVICQLWPSRGSVDMLALPLVAAAVPFVRLVVAASTILIQEMGWKWGYLII